jgi:hypothetical protein
MKPGATFIGMTTIYRVQIEGRGGDSAYDAYFETEEQALLASAIDGPGRKPTPVLVLKFSDGTLMFHGIVTLSRPPKDEEVAKILESLSPGQKVAFGITLGTALKKAHNQGMQALGHALEEDAKTQGGRPANLHE